MKNLYVTLHIALLSCGLQAMETGMVPFYYDPATCHPQYATGAYIPFDGTSIQAPVVPVFQQNITSQPTVPFDIIITNIDTAITNKYSKGNSLLNMLNRWQLSEKDMFNILETINKCYPQLNVSDEMINVLYEKNNFFAKAIDHFTQRASDNLNAVTSSTLNTITDATAQQKITSLNTLKLAIKKYVMEKVYNQIEHEYEMTFKTFNTTNNNSDFINTFDISPTKHLVAAGDRNNIVYIWDLKTTYLLNTLKNTYAYQIKFNHDGSRLMIYTWDQKYVIKEYDPLSGDALSTLDPELEKNEYIAFIGYTQNTPNNIICIIKASTQNDKTIQDLWLSNGGSVSHLGTIRLPDNSQIPAQKSIETENYHANHPLYQLKHGANTLGITKKRCAQLYLCKQAIKNTHSRTALKNIQHSLSYNSLTDYEKTMVNTNIQKRIDEITKAKKDSPKRTNNIQATHVIHTNNANTLSWYTK